MSEFGSEERRLLGALRVDEAPTRDDRDRVRARIASRLGVAVAAGAAAGVTATAVSTAGASPGAWGGITAATWLKMGAVVVVTGLGIGAVAPWSATPVTPHEQVPQGSANVSPVPEPRGEKKTVAQPELEPRQAEVQPTPSQPDSDKSGSETNSQPVVPTTQKPTDLQGELKLLGIAQQALKSGDSGAALRALDELSRKHPGGALSVEGAGLRAVALCASGQERAGKSAAKRFLKKNPGSPLAGRVRAACFSSAK